MAQEEQWITVNGRHILIGAGESKEDAIRRAIAQKNSDTKQKQIERNKEQADKLNGKSDSSELKLSEVKSDKFVNAIEKAKESQPKEKR